MASKRVQTEERKVGAGGTRVCLRSASPVAPWASPDWPQPPRAAKSCPHAAAPRPEVPQGVRWEKQALGWLSLQDWTLQMLREVRGIIGLLATGRTGRVIKAEHGLPAPREQCPGPVPMGAATGSLILQDCDW